MMLPHLQAAFAAVETAEHHALRLKKQDIGSLALEVCLGLDLGEAAALVLGAAEPGRSPDSCAAASAAP